MEEERGRCPDARHLQYEHFINEEEEHTNEEQYAKVIDIFILCNWKTKLNSPIIYSTSWPFVLARSSVCVCV